jgi:hypothetical protein
MRLSIHQAQEIFLSVYGLVRVCEHQPAIAPHAEKSAQGAGGVYDFVDCLASVFARYLAPSVASPPDAFSGQLIPHTRMKFSLMGGMSGEFISGCPPPTLHPRDAMTLSIVVAFSEGRSTKAYELPCVIPKYLRILGSPAVFSIYEKGHYQI